jgi:alkaline phosphatase
MATGLVSTARVTHATPAAAYAHTPERDWEADVNLPQAAKDAGFKDIARQLVEFPFGDGIEVAFGGGRSNFLPNTVADPEDAGRTGGRRDGRNLAAAWAARGAGHAYVWNKAQFDALDPATTRSALGLFERSHMEYEHDRAADVGGEPSLAEMTGKAIDILKKNRQGFFLMVEAGRIDHGHHAGNAARALTDTIALSDAVQAALARVDARDTLIVVTADHSHVFTLAGYPKRGNPILGKVVEPGETNFALDATGKPYTTLGYQNGPGYTGASNAQPEGMKTNPHFPATYQGITLGRPDLTAVDTEHANFLQEAAVPLGSETHAGEDVAIYAIGPQAHLVHGVMEQHAVYHVMAHALRLRKR